MDTISDRMTALGFTLAGGDQENDMPLLLACWTKPAADGFRNKAAPLVLIGGAFHGGAETFVSMLEQAGPIANRVVIIEWLRPTRTDHEFQSDDPRYVEGRSYSRIEKQVIITFQTLYHRYIWESGVRQPIVIGHSQGAAFARAIVETQLNRVGKIIEIAPVPTSWLSQLTNDEMKQMPVGLALQVQLFIFKAIFYWMLGKDIAYPSKVAQWLFVSAMPEDLDTDEYGEYVRNLRPMSARAFLTVLFVYGSKYHELLKACDQGWTGASVLIYFNQDRIIDHATAARNEKGYIEVYTMVYKVPGCHCWWEAWYPAAARQSNDEIATILEEYGMVKVESSKQHRRSGGIHP